MARTCQNCIAFDRENLQLPPQFSGDVRFPAQARCRRAPPPWPTVQDTDWCAQHMLRPSPLGTDQVDDGA